MKCENCGSMIENDDALFCPECGEATKMRTREENERLERILTSDDNQMNDDVRAMKCPACGAPISLDAGLEAVVCEYCKTKVFVDDEIYKYQRVLMAQSEAKKREARAKYELDKEKEKDENKRQMIVILKENPIQCAAVLLCTIWLIATMLSGHVGLGPVLVEIAVIIWALGGKRRPLFFTNLGIYLKNNVKQTIVFVLSLAVMSYCLSNATGLGLFFIAACTLIWSVRSGKKTGMIIDTDKGIRYIPIKGSSSHYTGKQCTAVMAELKACGFHDIQTVRKEDLIKGWFAKVGEVASISIDGKSSFSEGDEFPSNAKVVIEYHAFPA